MITEIKNKMTKMKKKIAEITKKITEILYLRDLSFTAVINDTMYHCNLFSIAGIIPSEAR